MPLFNVTVTQEIVVLADDAADAEDFATTPGGWFDLYDADVTATKIETTGSLPQGWDVAHPWRAKGHEGDGRTCGEILGGES